MPKLSKKHIEALFQLSQNAEMPDTFVGSFDLKRYGLLTTGPGNDGTLRWELTEAGEVLIETLVTLVPEILHTYEEERCKADNDVIHAAMTEERPIVARDSTPEEDLTAFMLQTRRRIAAAMNVPSQFASNEHSSDETSSDEVRLRETLTNHAAALHTYCNNTIHLPAEECRMFNSEFNLFLCNESAVPADQFRSMSDFLSPLALYLANARDMLNYLEERCISRFGMEISELPLGFQPCEHGDWTEFCEAHPSRGFVIQMRDGFVQKTVSIDQAHVVPFGCGFMSMNEMEGWSWRLVGFWSPDGGAFMQSRGEIE